MMVGMAVETTVDSKDASAVTSTSATVTARTRPGAKRAVTGVGSSASRATASGGGTEGSSVSVMARDHNRRPR